MRVLRRSLSGWGFRKGERERERESERERVRERRGGEAVKQTASTTVMFFSSSDWIF